MAKKAKKKENTKNGRRRRFVRSNAREPKERTSSIDKAAYANI